MFWSHTVCSGLSELGVGISLEEFFFFVLPPLFAMCQVVKIVYSTNTVFYKVMCKVFGYHNVLTTLDLENSLVWH